MRRFALTAALLCRTARAEELSASGGGFVSDVREYLASNMVLGNVLLPRWIFFAAVLTLVYLLYMLIVALSFNRAQARLAVTPREAMRKAGGASGAAVPTGESCYVDFEIRFLQRTDMRRGQVGRAYTIGGAGSDLCLDGADDAVAKRHCVLFISGGMLYAKPIGAADCYIGGRRIDDCAALPDKTVLQIGRHTICVHY